MSWESGSIQQMWEVASIHFMSEVTNIKPLLFEVENIQLILKEV